jgi:hypothetical protein
MAAPSYSSMDAYFPITMAHSLVLALAQLRGSERPDLHLKGIATTDSKKKHGQQRIGGELGQKLKTKVHSWLWKSLNKRERCYRDVGPEAAPMWQESAASGRGTEMICNPSISGIKHLQLFHLFYSSVERVQLCHTSGSTIGYSCFTRVRPYTPNEIMHIVSQNMHAEKGTAWSASLRRTQLLLRTFIEALLTMSCLGGIWASVDNISKSSILLPEID